MNPKILLGIVLLAPVLMGANNNGCNAPLPTVAQIELEIPENLRKCPGFPKSPGKAATPRQTAQYAVALYHALSVCKGNEAAVNKIYLKYRSEIELAKKAGYLN